MARGLLARNLLLSQTDAHDKIGGWLLDHSGTRLHSPLDHLTLLAVARRRFAAASPLEHIGAGWQERLVIAALEGAAWNVGPLVNTGIET